MDEETTRTVLIAIGFVFCLLFAGASMVAISEAQSTGGVVLGVVSLAVVGLILLGLIGAVRNPPDE